MGNWILLYWKIAPFPHCCNIQLLPESYVLLNYQPNYLHSYQHLAQNPVTCLCVYKADFTVNIQILYVYIQSFICSFKASPTPSSQPCPYRTHLQRPSVPAEFLFLVCNKEHQTLIISGIF